MRFVKAILLFLLVVLVGIQFIPTERNQSNEILEVHFINTFNVPQDIQNLLEKSCYDCHSNNTEYPWYNKIAPISWLLAKDVNKGKEELNFSEFGNYSNRRKQSKLKSMASQISDDNMPLPAYILMHKSANFSKSEKDAVIKFLEDLQRELE